MYKKILATVNEHLNSEVAARYALHLARACGAKLSLCFITEEGLSASGFEKAEEALKRLFIKAGECNVGAEIITGTGDPVKEISRMAKQQETDIVFTSTRREDVERRFYAGTVARSLSLSLRCSVALVRIVHLGRIHPKKILVPVKARVANVKERAYFTAKIARSFGSRVFVFHTVRPMKTFFEGELRTTPAQLENRLPADIAAFMENLKKYDIKYERRLLPGKASRNITVEAAAKRHDLIIMGASERSLLSSFFKGNPVEEVLRETPCDLIILKPSHEDK